MKRNSIAELRSIVARLGDESLLRAVNNWISSHVKYVSVTTLLDGYVLSKCRDMSECTTMMEREALSKLGAEVGREYVVKVSEPHEFGQKTTYSLLVIKD